jgi:hypothetical protein
MEHVPLEAWNEEGVELIFGDSCVFDRFDRRTVARETTQYLGCWVWMHDPDDLPKSLEYTVFAARAGQAMDVNGLTSMTRLPPTGMVSDKIILIHMAGYEDWNPRTPDGTCSRSSSEHGSSAAMFVPFEWTAGVPDGRTAPTRRTRPDGCHAPPEQRVPREDDGDDGDLHEPPRRADVSKSTRVRQPFPNCTSERSVWVRTRSPPANCRAGAANHAALDWGRQLSRSPGTSARGREALQHASEDWEWRRSRSPVTRPQLTSRDPLPLFSSQIQPQISLCKKKIPITSKYRHMHGVLNVDEI